MGLVFSPKGEVGLPLGMCGAGEARAPNCPFGDAMYIQSVLLKVKRNASIDRTEIKEM